MKISSPAPAVNASPVKEAASGPVLVWDAPVRVFHWLMVLSFAGAWLTAERDGWELVHVTLGYTMAGLVAFRLVWGLTGTRYARFSDFVRGPRSVVRYFGGMLRARPARYIGHNPAGAVAILATLALTVIVTATGWAALHELGGERFEELHEGAATVMLVVVGVHVAGVLAGSWLHRENLIGAMFSGRKEGGSNDGVRSARRSVAVILLLAVLGFWWYQWHATPVNTSQHTGQPVRAEGHDDD
jgi:cytochrome b